MSTHPIRAYREARDMNRVKFAELVGAKKAAVSKWERGIGPSPETAIVIEEKTGIPREALRPDIFKRTERRAPKLVGVAQ